MKSLDSNSSICTFNSANSSGGIPYGLLHTGAVPGINSMTNSTHRSCGMPGNSSANTSGKSQTTSTSWISGVSRPSIKYNASSGERGESAVEAIDVGDRYCTMSPEGRVTVTVLAAYS